MTFQDDVCQIGGPKWAYYNGQCKYYCRLMFYVTDGQ